MKLDGRKGRLFVEGQDDIHVIANLLQRHGLSIDKGMGEDAFLRAGGNDDGVLEALQEFANKRSLAPAGFVLDADNDVASRWASVCGRLAGHGYSLPDSLPPDGLIITSNTLLTKVGVWIMPDNSTSPGRLEDLLVSLVPQSSVDLWNHAKSSTEQARRHGAGFIDNHLAKAQLHCWLAWQKNPGRPYGMAISNEYFSDDSDAARRFVAWFRLLFGV